MLSPPGLDLVFPRIEKLLRRAYKLCLKSKGNGRLDYLLVINSDVEEILGIIKDFHLVRQPRVHLEQMHRVTVKTEPDSDGERHLEPIESMVEDDDAVSPANAKCDGNLALLPDESNHSAMSGDDFRVKTEPDVKHFRGDQMSDAALASLGTMDRGDQIGDAVVALPSTSVVQCKPPIPEDVCPMCRKKVYRVDCRTFEEKSNVWNLHLTRFHPEVAFRCDCGAVLCGETGVNDHLAKHSGGKVEKLLTPSECPHCEVEFADDDGFLTKPVRYFWQKKGDVNFIQTHVNACKRRASYASVSTNCRLFPRTGFPWLVTTEN